MVQFESAGSSVGSVRFWHAKMLLIGRVVKCDPLWKFCDGCQSVGDCFGGESTARYDEARQNVSLRRQWVDSI